MSRSDAELEAVYQGKLIKKIYVIFDDFWCQILKNDSGYQQGIPDLTVFVESKWAWLEVKPYEGAVEQPNQPWFVEKANTHAFGAFIYPENEKEVLRGLQLALWPTSTPRILRR